MNDESQLQIRRQPKTSAPGLSAIATNLIARGRRDASGLVRTSASEPEDPLSKARRLAEQGDVQAQWRLGYSYFTGNGLLLRGASANSPTIKQDFCEALKWFRKAAEAGDQCSARYVGYIFYRGLGVSKDYKEAVQWLTRGVPSEFGIAELYLGVCFYYGRGVQQDTAEAIQWLLKGLHCAVSSQTMYEMGRLLGCIYASGSVNVPRRSQPISAYARDAQADRIYAETGNSNAQFRFGLAYVYGRGVAQDDTKAAMWFRRAADSGEISAQFHLSLAYARGRGVPRNDILAHVWISLAVSAAEGEYAETLSLSREDLAARLTREQLAQAERLTYRWFERNEAPEDFGKAIDFWRKSAGLGHPAAQKKLALCYEIGAGVTIDYAEAGRWYREAGEQGDRFARVATARLFLEGRLRPLDDDQANYWVSLWSGWLSEEISAASHEAQAANMVGVSKKAPVIELMLALQRSLDGGKAGFPARLAAELITACQRKL